MFKLLNEINSPEDLKKLSQSELKIVAHDIRRFLIQSISKTGGHLASNLGVVELTMALHYVFNSPDDKFVWDVGHQAYVHKILTGRRRHFRDLRKLDGLSGFPKRHESVHDIFETGHSSTSISAALGMALARDLDQKNNQVVAIIGDGALTGGMAFEALNNAGRSNTKLIVILNDNEMSISENVGGITQHLNYIRSAKQYIHAKDSVEDLLQRIPVLGDNLVNTVKRTKDSVKSLLIENTLFEELGFTYLGPINGHDFTELIEILNNAKQINEPVLIHVKTKKGKGYRLAEMNPSYYHGVAPFDVKEGVSLNAPKKQSFSSAFGEAMLKLGKEDEKVLGITAAMCEGTGFTPFAKTFPSRFFDVGIAEQHAVTFAAGLAQSGYKPVFAVYSSFLQRAYDQVLHDVALQNLPVIFGIDRAGIVGEDGATHQGIFDISYLSHIPNLTLLAVKMPEEIEAALRFAKSINGPVAIRYPRGSSSIDVKYKNNFLNGNIQEIETGKHAILIGSGRSIEWALEIRNILARESIEIAIAEISCISPLDQKGLTQLAKQYTHCFTLEDHIIEGGLGQQIAAYIQTQALDLSVKVLGYESGVVEHGDIKGILEREQLSPTHVANYIKDTLRKVRT